jgi:hypothetical protein
VTGGGQTPPPIVPPPTGAAAAVTPPRAPGVVPVQPVAPGDKPALAPPPAQILVSPPPSELASGSQPHLMSIQITGVNQVGTVSLVVTFDPAVVKPLTVTPGTFMAQGGVAQTFVPKIDAQAGRIDISISRGDQVGASGSGLLAGLVFQAGAAGATSITVSASVTSVFGQAITVQSVPGTVTVR